MINQSFHKENRVDATAPWLLAIFLALWAAALAPAGPWNFLRGGAGEGWSRIFAFYPLLFLPVFVRSRDETHAALQAKLAGRTWLRDWLSRAEWIGALLLFGLGAHLDINTFQFFGGAWALLLGLRAFGFDVGLAGRSILFLIPPIADKLTYAIGFPLRVRLSEAAATLLRPVDPDTSASGNLIRFAGREAIVDPACEGLQMLGATTLLLLLLYRRGASAGLYGRGAAATTRVDFAWLLLLPPLAFGLWLASNLARIIALTIFALPSEHAGHGALGLLSFAGLVAAPCIALDAGLGLARRSALAADKESAAGSPAEKENRVVLYRRGGALAVAALFCALAWSTPERRPPEPAAWPERLAGLALHTNLSARQAGDARVYASADDRVRIILKQGLDPLVIGHPPSGCWSALGFRLEHEREAPGFQGGTLRRAILADESGRRYPMAYWYDPSNTESAPSRSGELEWRRVHFEAGTRFTLVNVIAADEAELERVLEEFERG